MKKSAHKIGAVMFILWGLVHVLGGLTMLSDLYSNGPSSTLKMLGPSLPPSDIPNSPGQAVASVIGFHSFNLVWFGVLSIIIAAKLNWKNKVVGFWVNTAIIGFSDIGLYLFLIAPGNMSWADGFVGPLLFIVGFVFSTIGLKHNIKIPVR